MKQNAEKEQELLDNLFCGAALYEYNGETITVIHINKRYWELVERTPIDLDHISVLSSIHPDDVSLVMQEIDNAINQRRNAECDIRILYGKNDYKLFHLDAVIKKNSNNNYTLYVTYAIINKQVADFQKTVQIALKTLMESSEDIIFVKDRNLRFICCSKPAVQILKINNISEIVGKTDYDFFDKERADMVVAIDKKVIESRKTQTNRTVLIQGKDGKVHVFYATKYPIMDSDGGVVGIYGVFKDITESKERESQLHLLLSGIPGGIASYSIQNDKYNTLYYNEGYYKPLGYSREEYVALTAKSSLALIYPADQHIIREMLEKLKEPQNHSEIQECEYRSIKKDGTLRWMNMKCGLTKLGDTSIINVVQTDITESKEVYEKLRLAEEEYRLAIQHSERTIGRYDVIHQTLTLTSKAAERLSLPECIEGVPYERVRLGLISSETARAYIAFYESIMNGEMNGSVFFQKLLADKWQWINARFTTLFSDEGKPVAAVVSYINVTDQYEKMVSMQNVSNPRGE